MNDYVDWLPTVEYAPGFSPMNPPSSGDWVVLGRPLNLSFDRGRQDDLDEYETGRASFAFDNSSNAFDQLDPASLVYNADGLPFTPIRLRLTKQGGLNRSVIRWTGYTRDGFVPSGDRGAGTARCDAVDWLGWASRITLPDSRFASWIQSERPTYWLRGDLTRYFITASTNDYAFNSAQLWEPAYRDSIPDPAYTVGGVPGVSRAQSIVPGSQVGSFALGDSSGTSGVKMRDTIPQTGSWSACGWVKSSAPSFGMYVGSGAWNVSLGTTGYLDVTINVGGFFESTSILVDHSDGNPHFWRLVVQSIGGTRYLFIYSDLGSAGHTFGAAAVSGGGQIDVRGSHGTQVQEIAYFADKQLSPATAFGTAITPAAWVAGTDALWWGEAQQARLNHLVAAAGVPNPGFNITIDTVPTRSLATFEPPANLAAGVASIAASYLGGAWVQPSGSVRIRDATFSNGGYGTTRALITDDPAIVEGRKTTTVGTDSFTRANNASVIGGAWTTVSPGGTFGIISNRAYMPSAHASLPGITTRDAGSGNHAITATLSGAVDGQGLVIRYADPTNFTAAVKQGTQVWVFSVEGGGFTLIAYVTGAPGTMTFEGRGSYLYLTVGGVETEIVDPAAFSPFFTSCGLIGPATTTPPNTATFDDVTITVPAPTVVRCTARSRSGTRPDKVVNDLTVALHDSTINVRAIDWASKARYGPQRKALSSESSTSSEIRTLAQSIVADKAAPPVEVGDLTFKPIGDQASIEWLIEQADLDSRVRYAERQYRTGTVVLDVDMRIARESWRWKDRRLDVVVRLVPA